MTTEPQFQIEDVVMVERYYDDLNPGIISDTTVHGSFRVHFGGWYDYFYAEDIRLATPSEALEAKPVRHPSTRLGF